MNILFYILLVLAAIGFVYAGWRDYMTWKIGNRTVLILTGLYIPFAATGVLLGGDFAGKTSVLPALGAGALLLAIGFGLWQFRLFGAGDAKLMFPAGLFAGWDYLMIYALWLGVFAVVAFLALKLPLPAALGQTIPGMRLDEIRRTGKVPYGVVMAAAMLATLYMKYLSVS